MLFNRQHLCTPQKSCHSFHQLIFNPYSILYLNSITHYMRFTLSRLILKIKQKRKMFSGRDLIDNVSFFLLLFTHVVQLLA